MATEAASLALTLAMSGLIMGIVTQSGSSELRVSGGAGELKRNRLLGQVDVSEGFVTADRDAKRSRFTRARAPTTASQPFSQSSQSQTVPQYYDGMVDVVNRATDEMFASATRDPGAGCRAICRAKPELMAAEQAINEELYLARRKIQPIASDVRIKRKPKPHQTFVADALVSVPDLEGLVVVHGLGSGKTITGITAALSMLAEGISEKIMVVAPAMLIAQWRDEISKYISMRDVDPPASIRRAIQDDPDIASRIYIVSYNAFGNKYRKIIMGLPVKFETIAASPACDPDDEELSFSASSSFSYAEGIRALETALKQDPQLAENRLRAAFVGFGLIVDEAHRLVRGFARLSQPLRAKLVNRGVERDMELEQPELTGTDTTSPESAMSPETLESLVAVDGAPRISHKLSFIQAIVDCLALFTKRVLMTATPAPNEPEDFGRMSALARALPSAPDMEPFTTVRSVMGEDQTPVTQVIMHKDAVERNVGSLISYYPSNPLPGEATAFPELSAAWVYVPMSRSHAHNYFVATGERDDANYDEMTVLSQREEMQRRMRQQIAKRLLGIWNRSEFVSYRHNAAVPVAHVQEHFPKMAEVMKRITHQTFGGSPGPVIIYVEYESCIDDIVRCIRAYCKGACDLNEHMDTMGRLPVKEQSRIQDVALTLRDQLATQKRDTGTSLRFCRLTSKTSHAQRIMMQALLTRADNADGNLVRILIMTSAGCEGLDLKWVKQVHILAPPWTASRVQQVVGRAVRFCSHPATGRDVTDRVDAYFYTSVLPSSLDLSDERAEMNEAHRDNVRSAQVVPYVKQLIAELVQKVDLQTDAAEAIEAQLVDSVAANPMQTCANLRIDIVNSVKESLERLNVTEHTEIEVLKVISKLAKTDIRSRMTSRERLKADAAFSYSDHTSEQETWTKLIQDWYKLNAVQKHVATLSIDCPLHYGRSGLNIHDCKGSESLEDRIIRKLQSVSTQCVRAIPVTQDEDMLEEDTDYVDLDDDHMAGGGEVYQLRADDVEVDQSERFMGMPGILQADEAYEDADDERAVEIRYEGDMVQAGYLEEDETPATWRVNSAPRKTG